MTALAAAKGVEFDRQFRSPLMIAHHEERSGDLGRGVAGAARHLPPTRFSYRFTRRYLRTSQTGEIERVDVLLARHLFGISARRGWPPGLRKCWGAAIMNLTKMARP